AHEGDPAGRGPRARHPHHAPRRAHGCGRAGAAARARGGGSALAARPRGAWPRHLRRLGHRLMPPFLASLVDFGHLLGAVLGIGGLFHLGFASLPASNKLPDPERTQFLSTLRWRGRVLTYTAVLLLLGTGLIKWMPATGIGWLGYGGIRTAFL